MKCPNCEYELWNLRAGPCPECGRPFMPSEFDFLSNAVKFCCPHCAQAYYGTGEHGELVPGAFDCVSCGRHVTTDEMLLLPADELGDRTPTRTVNPWLESNRKRRWFATIVSGIGQPGRMLEATPPLGASGKALGFAMLNFFAAALLSIALSVVLLFAGGGGGTRFLFYTAGFSIFVPAIYMFVWTLLTHGLLKLFKQQTPHGIGRTFQAVAFTSGAWLLALIPCAGWPMAFVAWTACAPAAVYAAHKCRLWSAIVATLVPPTLVAASVAGLYIWMMFGTLASVQSATTQYAWAAGGNFDYEVIELTNELRSAVNSGSPPLHGASLLGPASPVPFTAFSDAQNVDVAIGSVSASRISSMHTPDRIRELSAITVMWPADITAHRIGRIVFTHHGVGPGDDPRLWLLIELPNTPGDQMADVAHLSGASMFNVATGGQQAVDQQNRLRANAGLPPLPSFQTMTSGTGPWTAADGTPPPATPGVP